MFKRPVWLIVAILFFAAPGAEAGTARIKKVLPHYLDLEGRHMLAPSLYERDAYQAHLRQHPEERSALRFDINWTGGRRNGGDLRLRLEIRGSGRDPGDPLVLEVPVKPPLFLSRWSAILVEDDAYRRLGEVTAWRATLWQDGTQVAEQKSFLW